MSRRKYFRVILINTETGERQMLVPRYTSKKQAIRGVTSFCIAVGIKADFEILEDYEEIK